MNNRTKEITELIRENIEKQEALARLKSNKDFQLIINDCFIKAILEDHSTDIISGNEILQNIAIDKVKAVNYLKACFDNIEALTTKYED